MGPQRETYTAAAEDVLIDITIPPRRTFNHAVYECYNIIKSTARQQRNNRQYWKEIKQTFKNSYARSCSPNCER